MSSPRCVCSVGRVYVLMLLTDEAQAMKIDWKDESKNATESESGRTSMHARMTVNAFPL